MRPSKSVCVFCGLAVGDNSIFSDKTIMLAEYLARSNIRVIYGGGRNGLMGLLANTALNNGGEVIGVIPKDFYEQGWGHESLSSIKVVGDIDERKKVMADLADAFIALPGGVGTLEEVAEAISWNQMDIHSKMCGLLNIEGFYNGLMLLYDTMRTHGFIRKPNRNLCISDENPIELVRKLGLV